MCLAVPLKILDIDPQSGEGTVAMGAGLLRVGLDLTPAAKPGDYVLVHAGLAIEVLPEEEAKATLDVFREYAHVPGLLAPEGE